MKVAILSGNEKKPLEEFTLGVLQPQAGHPRDAVGYGSGSKPSPIFDLLTRSAKQQSTLLASGADLTGWSWGPHAGNDLAASVVSQVEAPAASVTPTQGTGKKTFLSNPLDYLAGMFSANPVPVATATPAPVQALLDPQAALARPQTPNAQPSPAAATTPPPAIAAAPAIAVTPAPAVTPAASSISQRLQSLQQLYDSKVITESEYKQQRLRILSEL
jgi:hypothetical protein